jgi:hypothetical protein
MRRIRRRLSYANVVSTLALFLVLAGGAAYAAHKLTRRSVGTPQLKSNAVTTAKIKANAVTTRKIKRIAVSSSKLKEGAVTTEKLQDGAVTTDKIDLEDVPFSHVVARLRGNQHVELENLERTVYPLGTAAYTQGADEVDSYVGAVDVTFKASCEPPRAAQAYVMVDSSKPTDAKEIEADLASFGRVSDSGTTTMARRIQIAPSTARGITFEPGAQTPHTLSLVVLGECNGASSGITATSGAVDVIGVR